MDGLPFDTMRYSVQEDLCGVSDQEESVTALETALVRVWPRASSMRRRESHYGDRLFHALLRGLGWALIALLAGLLLTLVALARPTLAKYGLGFFVGRDWNPAMDSFGALPSIYGTLVSSFIALLLAAPISIGVALFLTELAPLPIARTVGFLVEMLAAIPSVVFGLWGIFVLSPWMQKTVQPALVGALGPDTRFAMAVGHILTPLAYIGVLSSNLVGLTGMSLGQTSEAVHAFAQRLFAGPGYGVGLLTSGIVLAIMITPTVSAISREVFSTVNQSVREAALALGATRWEMIRMAVIKTCRSGILGALILGLGRALGETMAVTMVIGNRSDISAAILAPAQTMASVIANEYPEASGLHMSSLAAIALALFAVSMVINSFARLIIWRVERGAR